MFDKLLLDELMSEALFDEVGDIKVDEYRELTIKRLNYVIKLVKLDISKVTGEVGTFLKIMNTLHIIDVSLAIAFGVNFGLYGGSLINFSCGENDVVEYIDKLNKGEHIGCLAITEIGHGSNIKKLSTTATYNLKTRTFTINTPDIDSYKCWIGNAKYATHCVVFAKLILKGKNYDLHPFLVNLKTEGVVIIDNGQKNGLNGVANCVLIFNNVMIPECNLLGKFGYIKDGVYNISDKYVIKTKEGTTINTKLRFADLLSTLSGGRLILSSGCVALSMQALVKTYHYSRIRKQFNFDTLKGETETEIIRYPTFFSGLFLQITKSYLLNFFIHHVKDMATKYYIENGFINKQIHILTSSVKIFGSELADESIRLCRKLCAGNGFLHKNSFGSKFNDVDIYKTFEGDNTLLRLEVAAYAIETFAKRNKITGSYSSSILFYIKRKLENLMYSFENLNVRNIDSLICVLRRCQDFLCVEFLNEIMQSRESYVTTWNKNLLLVTAISNLQIINSLVNFVSTSPDTEKYLFRYFLLNCIKDNSFILSRCQLLSGSQLNIISKMMHAIHHNISSGDFNYFVKTFSTYFSDIGSFDILTSEYSKLFTISYPGDKNWVAKFIPSKI